MSTRTRPAASVAVVAGAALWSSARTTSPAGRWRALRPNLLERLRQRERPVPVGGRLSHELGHHLDCGHPPGREAGAANCDRPSTDVEWISQLRRHVPQTAGALVAPVFRIHANSAGNLRRCHQLPTRPPHRLLLFPRAAPTGLVVTGDRPHCDSHLAGVGASHLLRARGRPAPGLANLYNADVGNTTLLSATAPRGTDYVRVRARNLFGHLQRWFDADHLLGRCWTRAVYTAPSAPSGLTFSGWVCNVTLTWASATGAPRLTSSKQGRDRISRICSTRTSANPRR